MNILVCTLGTSWAVIAEIYCWLDVTSVDLYQNHPEAIALLRAREAASLATPDELWVVTTANPVALKALDQLDEWWALLGTGSKMRAWIAAECSELKSVDECAAMKELIARVHLRASENCENGQLLVSLAGGRKTMSADMQWAANRFGAAGLLHVVGADDVGPIISRLHPKDFTSPLPENVAARIFPMSTGAAPRSELVGLAVDGEVISSASYSIELGGRATWQGAGSAASLVETLQRREETGAQSYGNYLRHLGESELIANWRSLYRLPPEKINQCQTQCVVSSEESPALCAWLKEIPKADLHRHLGGCLGIDAQIRVARSILACCSKETLINTRPHLDPILHQINANNWEWADRLRQHKQPRRALLASLLLTELTREQLYNCLARPTEPRIALKYRHRRGFSAYERPGELTGSAVLGHPDAIAPYALEIVRACRQENLWYCELRGSPHKYRPNDPAAFVAEFEQAILDAGGVSTANPPNNYSAETPMFGFIWILDRRQSNDDIAKTVQQAMAQDVADSNFLLAFDLAGDEGTTAPEELAEGFLPVFERCKHVTVHAGEGESPENIWQAAYHLHADRIGHGLTLWQKPELLARFRDRGISLEMCPTSNREVVGFYDPLYEHATQSLPRYPLKTYLRLGVGVVICTDNPGFSGVDVSDELVAAARMAGGLSLWEVLALVRMGFSKAFATRDVRSKMLVAADAVTYAKVAKLCNTSNR